MMRICLDYLRYKFCDGMERVLRIVVIVYLMPGIERPVHLDSRRVWKQRRRFVQNTGAIAAARCEVVFPLHNLQKCLGFHVRIYLSEVSMGTVART